MDEVELSRLLENCKKVNLPSGEWDAQTRLSDMTINFTNESRAKALSDLARSILDKLLKEQLDQEPSYHENLLAILNTPVDPQSDQ
jgi:hypothetical protein